MSTRKIQLPLAMVIIGTLAQAAEPDSPAPYLVIVTAEKTPIMASDETLETVGAGTVLLISKENGSWILVPQYQGWVKKSDVLAIDQAEEYFTKLIEQKPTGVAFHHRGITRSEKGQFDEAIADFNEALKLAPKSPGVYVNRGVAHERSQQQDKALADFTEALKLSPDHALALWNRSNILLEKGQVDAALVDIDALLKLDPESPEAHLNHGLAQRLQGKFPEAIADYDQAIELDEKFAAAYANRGYAKKHTGDYAGALADYEKAQELEPELLDALNDGAWLLATCKTEEVRDAARAVEMAEKARSLSEKPSGDILDTLAAAYAAAGRYEDAVKTAEQAVELIPEQERTEIVERLERYRRNEPFVEQ